jgi:LytR cell envelope-related transcriptional attenuator
MNQRDSSGLPLRAMVMVLLFLGVVFLLVGFQAMRSGDDEDAQAPIASSTISSTQPSASEAPGPPRAEVRVFNISTVQDAAEGVANRLRDADWKVIETGNLELPNVTATTVYFSDAPGERKAAEEVGRLLEAPVEPRVPELADQPPGVVVAVTG